MLQSVVDKIFSLWGSSDETARHQDTDTDTDTDPDLPGSVAQPAPDTEFGGRMLGMATGPGKIVAGAMTLVGLAPVKLALAERWPQVEAAVGRVTARVLSEMVQPPDIYTHHSADNVLLCFASPNQEIAEYRTSLIAQTLQAALEREISELNGKIQIDFVVAELQIAEVVAAGTNLAAGLLSTLQRVRDEARLNGRVNPGTWMRSARLLFQPLWESAGSRTGPNRCVIDIAGAGATLAQLEDISENEVVAEAKARIDFLTFARAIETLHASIQEFRQASLMIPLHYQTLERPAWRSDYLKMCSMVPHKYRDFVHLEILNLPEAATSAQLAGYVKLLDLATSSVVLQVSLLRAQPTGLHKAGLSGLSFNFAELERLKNLKKPLTALASYAAAEGLASYAIGANTIGQAQAARDAGFTYIGGSAIHATVSEPRTAVRFAPLPQKRNRWSSYTMG